MNNSKAAIVISQIIEKIEMLCGGLWFALMALVALVCMFDESADGAGVIITIWIFAFIGAWVFTKGRKRKKMRQIFKNYVAQLSVDPTGQIENIAAATGTSVDVVKKNLQFMIKKRFFTNAYIDENNNQLVLPVMAQKPIQPQDNSINQNDQTAISPDKEYVTCNCPNCGGINRIVKGMVAECDFCGSPLQG